MAVVGQPPAPAPAPTGQPSSEQDVEYLLRGPLHEAFAEPVNFNPQPGIVVPKAPPNPVPEMPPAVKPSEEAAWISGYWAWDDDRSDFIWISGVYRVTPPDQRWVPGYWERVAEGYQWVAGFWASQAADHVEYLPQPPESLEQGPSSPAPSADYFWVSGSWDYAAQRLRYGSRVYRYPSYRSYGYYYHPHVGVHIGPLWY